MLVLLLHVRLVWIDLRSRLSLLWQLMLLLLALLRELLRRHAEGVRCWRALHLLLLLLWVLLLLLLLLWLL